MRRKSASMKRLFRPRSIAIIGASHKKNKIGYRITQNVLSGGFLGKVYLINPKGGRILGHAVCKSMDDIDNTLDVACIAIPSEAVFDSIRSCTEKGVKFAIIISSGFSEVGNSAEEEKIVSYARAHGMRVLGPNVFGIYSSAASLNATFGPKDILPGNIGIVTQSGAIGGAMIGKTRVENIGLSTIVSVGNKSDIDEADLLEYLVSDKRTKVILMYIEGVKKGERLVSILKEATMKKPVIAIKSGRSKRGAMAAASHTGSLAGADEIFDDIARQCNTLRAENIQEALDWCRFLSNSPIPRGGNTVIITNGGGLGVLAADACEKYNLSLLDDAQTLKKVFSRSVPEFGSVRNPVDLTGQATLGDYDLALDSALRNHNIHLVISLGAETAFFDAKKFARMVKESYQDYKSAKPVVYSVLGGERAEDYSARLKKEGIPIFLDVYEAVSCVGALHSYHHGKTRRTKGAEKVRLDIRSVRKILREVREEKRHFLLSHEAQEVMKAIGIQTPRSHLGRSLRECIDNAEDIGYPVVMKVVSKDIIHKSDVGGVALNLENEEEVADAYEAVLHRCRTRRPDALIEGVEVSQMVESNVETIVGARRDPSFGPVVMFGLGGIYVEVMKDVSFRAFPTNRQETMKMISEIRSYPLLLGVRGEEEKDVDAIADAIVKVGTLLEKCKDISDIEINPLVVFDKGIGVKAVDVRILLSKT